MVSLSPSLPYNYTIVIFNSQINRHVKTLFLKKKHFSRVLFAICTALVYDSIAHSGFTYRLKLKVAKAECNNKYAV
jgi:hypothetical protein